MAAATARGTSDARIFALPRCFAPGNLERVQPAHENELFDREPWRCSTSDAVPRVVVSASHGPLAVVPTPCVAHHRLTALPQGYPKSQRSELDRVPVDVRDIGVRNAWSVFAAVEKMTPGLLDQFDSAINSGR